MIKAVLFDIGNVIVRWDRENLYRKLIPDATKRAFFLDKVCSMAWHTRHDEGVSFADNRAALLKDWPQYVDLITAFDTRFDEMLDGAVEQTEAVMGELQAKGVVMYGLTNMPDEKAELVFGKSQYIHTFKDIIISAHEKLTKPDPAIYQVALQRMDLRAPDVFFTDDNAANIATANTMGFVTHHFTDPEGLRPALVDAGVL
jgi:HAD superfamily hydrolase (TIGR01549 family)